MTVRDQRIDRLLAELRLAEETLSAKHLASMLHVSTRSIREYVRALNSRFDEAIVQSDQYGYRLDARAYRQARTRRAQSRPGPSDRGGRAFAILDSLLRQPGGVDIFDLAARLNFSESTIESDLVRIRQMVRGYGLSIERQGDQLRLAGAERDKRRFFRTLLTQTEPLGEAAPSQPPLERQIAAALEPFDLDPNDYALRDVALHLTIAANRVASGNVLPDAEQRLDSTGWPGAAVDALARTVQHEFDVDLPNSERGALSRVLAARFNPTRSEDLDPRVETFVRESIAAVADHYLLELGDESTVQALTLHVQELIRRGALQQQIETPLGTDFKRSHALIHEVSLFFAARVEQFAGFALASSEVDFLSFHLGSQFERLLQDGPPVRVILALPQHGPSRTGKDVRVRRALEGNASLVGTIDFQNPDPDVDFDLAITTGDGPWQLHDREVRISPFFTQADMDTILTAVREVRRRMTRQHLKSALLGLIRPSLYRRVETATQSEAIHLLASDLAEQGFVAPDFEIDVLDRERRSSTNFGGRFAIPHSMFLDANETAMALLTCPTDIPWPEAPVQLVAMFAVAGDSRDVFRDAIDELNRVFQDPRSVARLVSAGTTYPEFVRHLSLILDG